jgi:hypothetical protein
MDLYYGHFIHAQDRVIGEIGLFHSSAVQSNGAVEGSGKTEDDCRFHLGLDRQGVDRSAAVYGAHDPVDAYSPVSAHRHLGHLGDGAVKGFVNGDAPPPACRQAGSPPCFLCCEIEHSQMA